MRSSYSQQPLITGDGEPALPSVVQQPPPVLVILENVLPSARLAVVRRRQVPAVRDMIHRPRIFDTQLPRHGQPLPTCPNSVNSYTSTRKTREQVDGWQTFPVQTHVRVLSLGEMMQHQLAPLGVPSCSRAASHFSASAGRTSSR
jgi:hypothetical protein